MEGTLASAADARYVANYLWNSLLGGTGNGRDNFASRPFLDGIESMAQLNAGTPYLKAYSSPRRDLFRKARRRATEAQRTSSLDSNWIGYNHTKSSWWNGR